LRVLHIHPAFDAGGTSLRTASLINAFGRGVEHAIVAAELGAYGATEAIDRGIAITYPQSFPALTGMPTLGRLQRLAKAMRGHDLILTFGWGAMDAVMAHTLFGEFHGLPPLVHHEEGFGSDDLRAPKRTRTWYRRIAFARTSCVIVPSRRLETVACESWQLPAGKVKRIPTGVDTAAYGRTPKPDALPRVIKRPGERWLGTLGALTQDKNLPRLVRAFAQLPDEWQLVILGEGPEREAIRDEALRLEAAHRVHLPGHVADPAKIIGLFDLFALSSDGDDFPVPTVAAMAAGLAIVSANVGDVVEFVAEENLPFIAASGDDAALASALLALAKGEVLRRRIGDANRRRAKAEFDAKAAVAAYRATYAQALRRQSFP
jgi:glycosyltransferase involved in cell wall biosynthesis